MRSFLSKGGWKLAALKIKTRKKAKGIMIVSAALATLVWILIAQGFFYMSSGAINTVQFERVAKQAKQNAELDTEKLTSLDFDDLDAKGAHGRQAMPGIGDGLWESEVTLDPETLVHGLKTETKMRIAHVSIYRKGDPVSRYNLDIPLTELLSQRYKELKELVAKLDARITTLEGRADRMEAKLKELNERVSKLEGDVGDIKRDINSTENEVTSTRSAISNARSSVSNLSGRVSNLESKPNCSGGSGSSSSGSSSHRTSDEKNSHEHSEHRAGHADHGTNGED